VRVSAKQKFQGPCTGTDSAVESKHDKTDPIIWQNGTLVDLRIKVNVRLNQYLLISKGKECLLVPRRIAVVIINR